MEDLVVSEPVAAIIYSAVGGVIVLICQFGSRFIQESRGSYSGTWTSEILDDQTMSPIKVDEVKLRQRGNFVRGKINRISPQNMNYRKYKFMGKIAGSNFYAIFWPISDDITSFGCWYVRQTEDGVFEGFYMRRDSQNPSDIQRIPLRMRRKNL